MKKLTTEEFIKRAKQVHGDKYDYSKTVYVDYETLVTIICPIHGEFVQIPSNHLQGKGCKECKKEKLRKLKRKPVDVFIKEAQQVHGNKYDYSRVNYIDMHKDVCIICPIHGEFWQTPSSHINGCGCQKCRTDKMKRLLTTTFEEFVEKSRQVHGDKYDYSKVNYVNNKTDVCIICPIHGEFWQTPSSHISSKEGCSKCRSSHLENTVRQILNKNNINFVEQEHFDWLGKQSLDFYIPSKNIAIECQGIQHFKPIEFFGGEEYYKKRLFLDKKKKQLCDQYNIKILYYSDLQLQNEYNIITDIQVLLENIKKC